MEDEARNVYREVQDRHVLCTADVYETEIEDGVTGYSDTLLSVVANFRNGACPRRVQRPEHGGQVEARRGGAAPVRRDRPRHADVRARRLQDARLPGRHGVRQRGVLHARRMYVRRGAGHHDRRREDGARRGSRGQGVHYPFRHRGRPVPSIGDYLVRQGASSSKKLDAVVPCNSLSVPCMICEHCSSEIHESGVEDGRSVGLSSGFLGRLSRSIENAPGRRILGAVPVGGRKPRRGCGPAEDCSTAADPGCPALP